MRPILTVAFLLASRTIRRGSIWQTGLVIFIMTLTFLNLAAISGILVGLIDGALNTYNRRYAGDILISKFPEKNYIENSSTLRALIETNPEVVAISGRYGEAAKLVAGFQRNIYEGNTVPDTVGVEVVGIDLSDEERVTDLHTKIIEGAFLESGDEDSIVLGSYLVDRYFPAGMGLQTLSGVFAGDKIQMTIGDVTRVVTVTGIVHTKADAADLRVYMLGSELRKIIGRSDYNVDEFAIRLREGVSAESVQKALVASGAGSYGRVQTVADAVGEFLDEIKKTFSLLGDIVGSIGLIVASITVFIVIFISAITRRKYIGILKAIGVSDISIELSYVGISLFYAFFGITLGLIILYGFLIPYFYAHPIDFPFSEGVISVTAEGTIIRSFLIGIATVIAGYVPAKLIVRRNTLDAILGR